MGAQSAHDGPDRALLRGTIPSLGSQPIGPVHLFLQLHGAVLCHRNSLEQRHLVSLAVPARGLSCRPGRRLIADPALMLLLEGRTL